MGRKTKYNWDELLKEYLDSEYQNKSEFAKARGINPSFFRRNTVGWPEKGEGVRESKKPKTEKSEVTKKTKSKSKVTAKKKSNVTSKKKNSVTEKQENKKPPYDNGKNICGAKAKQTGQPCRRPAGWGTSHPGTGRCKLHGGCSPGGPKGNKKARTHGIYETIIRDRLSEDEQAVFDAISDTTNMSHEIKILRFKLLRLLSPVEKQAVVGTEFGPEIVTLQVDEVTKAYAIEKLIDGIRKIVKDTKDKEPGEEGVKIVDDVK